MRVTDQATRVVSAGWYQDPASSVQVRWWNGLAWTEHVREKPTTSPTMGQSAVAQGGVADAGTDSSAHIGSSTQIGSAASTSSLGETAAFAETTETHEQRIAAVRDLEHQFGIGAVENPLFGSRASGQVATPAPMLGAATSRSAARGSTAAAWMIALSPLLALVVGVVAAYIYLYLFQNILVFVIAVAIPYLLCVLWAFADGRTLRARGFTPPSPALALLTGLGYLIVRRTRVPGSGPIAMLLVVAVLGFGAPLLASGLGATQGLANALNIQRTISADYISHDKAVFVNCPPFVDATTVGSLYTCDATLGTGVHRTIWVSIDGDGRFSYSFGL